MIQGHGDDMYSYNEEIKINFSSNVYNKQDMSDLEEYLREKIHLIHSYPDPDASSLGGLLALKNKIDITNISVTNGATEAIYLIAQAFRKKNSIIITPTFSEYADACKINEHQIIYTASLLDIEKYTDTDLVWLCNPNNPNGMAYLKEYLYKFIKEHPRVLFIVDQSYEAFVNHDYVMDPSQSVLLSNVINLHSMTKKYAIPGLRLGYVTAHESLITKINQYRMPWSVNRLAIEAGKYLLKEDKIYFDLDVYLAETLRLMTDLNSIEGLVVLPTSTHFFLCELIHKKASDLKKYLIENHGILIRDASNFVGLDEHYFRIATQSHQENDILVKTIKEWIQKH